jgi:hypothetical protein
LGFALGWNYYFKYIIVTPNQLTATSLVLQFWVKRDKINPGAFIAIFLVAIVCINYFGIKFFGEFEFVSLVRSNTTLTLLIFGIVALEYQGRRYPRSYHALLGLGLRWRSFRRAIRIQVLEKSWCFQSVRLERRRWPLPRSLELHDNRRLRLLGN